MGIETLEELGEKEANQQITQEFGKEKRDHWCFPSGWQNEGQEKQQHGQCTGIQTGYQPRTDGGEEGSRFFHILAILACRKRQEERLFGGPAQLDLLG